MIDLKRKIANIILMCMIMFSCISSAVFAETVADENIVASGKCGSNVFWTLDDAGVLNITGTGSLDGASAIRKSQWSDMNVKNVVINEGITRILYQSFYRCDTIESVSFPDSLEFIAPEAFHFCESLKKVYIGENIKEVCDDAFEGCRYTDFYYTYGKDSVLGNSCPFYGADIYLTIAPSVEEIGVNEFEYTFRVFVKSITISEGVKRIGHKGFADARVTDIVLPESLESIRQSAFQGCEELETVVFLNPDTKITNGINDVFSFQNCTIKGYIGSTAHKLAEENNLEFIPLDDNVKVVYGDSNGDSRINVKDAVLVLQYANRKITADKLDLDASDVNGDGKVNVKDAVMVLQYANKKINMFPVEQ